MRPPVPVAAAAVLALVLSSAACSSARDTPDTAASVGPTASTAPSTPSPLPTPTPSPAASVEDVTMVISGFEFVVPASVRPGAQVTVRNEDREAHTVTIDGGAVRTSVLPGATAVFTAPATAGPHPLVCDLHGGMDAVLVVA